MWEMKSVNQNINQQTFDTLKERAKRIRLSILDMITKSKSSHIGSAFSIVEILTALYHYCIDVDLIKEHKKERDYFILSKGHAASALYATLASVGVLDKHLLKQYGKDGTMLAGHPIQNQALGIEASTGSLGHGLPLAVGLALACKNDGIKNRIYVLLGDGECQEGSVWEAVNLASKLQLHNLTIIVDNNELQGLNRTTDVVTGNLVAKFKAFGSHTFEINGHDFAQLTQALDVVGKNGFPDVIIANTLKGFGVSFMQDVFEWHYKSPNEQEYEIAANEIVGL